MAPEDVADGHVRVDVLREPDADRDLDLGVLLLDLGRGLDEVLPRARSARHPDLRPDRSDVVARVGHPHVGQGELLLREGVVGTALDQVDGRAVLLLDRPDNVSEIDHVLLEGACEAQEHVNVMSGLGGDLRRSPRHHVGEAHVIHDHVDTLRGAPPLGPGVEPLVVRRYEMAPLENPQGTDGARAPGQDGGTHGGRGEETSPFDEEPSTTFRTCLPRLDVEPSAGLDRPETASHELARTMKSQAESRVRQS